MMIPKSVFSILICLIAFTGYASSADDGDAPGKISFVKDIKPVFEKRCVHCHNRKTLPDRISFEDAKRAFATDKFGKSYFVPGNPDASLIVVALESADFHEMMMPMVGLRTTPSENAKIRQWIAEGAHWPKGKEGKVKVTFRAKE